MALAKAADHAVPKPPAAPKVTADRRPVTWRSIDDEVDLSDYAYAESSAGSCPLSHHDETSMTQGSPWAQSTSTQDGRYGRSPSASSASWLSATAD